MVSVQVLGAGRLNGSMALSLGPGLGTCIDYSPEQVTGPALPRSKLYQAAGSFLRATRPSISGQNGHDRLFRAAATMVKEGYAGFRTKSRPVTIVSSFWSLSMVGTEAPCSYRA